MHNIFYFERRFRCSLPVAPTQIIFSAPLFCQIKALQGCLLGPSGDCSHGAIEVCLVLRDHPNTACFEKWRPPAHQVWGGSPSRQEQLLSFEHYRGSARRWLSLSGAWSGGAQAPKPKAERRPPNSPKGLLFFFFFFFWGGGESCFGLFCLGGGGEGGTVDPTYELWGRGVMLTPCYVFPQEILTPYESTNQPLMNGGWPLQKWPDCPLVSGTPHN